MSGTSDKEPSISNFAKQWAKLPCNFNRELNLKHLRAFSQLTDFKQKALSCYNERAIPIGKLSIQAFNKHAANAHASLIHDLKLNNLRFRKRSDC